MTHRVQAAALAFALVAAASWARPGDIRAAGATQPDPADELYRHREDLVAARRAADLWVGRAEEDFDAAWKLSRVSYWIGTHALAAEARSALDRGVGAGETAVRLSPNRPEGHFWSAANMVELAQSFGLRQGLKYRARIRAELERAVAVEPGWNGGVANAALGQWYFDVPRLFGGSRAKAEEQLHVALGYDANNEFALSVLAEVLIASGRREGARALLERVMAAPGDPEHGPESAEFKRKAAARLATLNQ